MNSKVVIVTGASRGIGASIAKILAKEGYLVIGSFIASEEKASLLKEEVEKEGGKFFPLKADVRKSEDCKKIVSYASSLGQVYGLVNNAGINMDSLLIRMRDEAWEEVIETNLNGAFYMTKYASKEMMKNREGAIVNLTSVVGLYGNAGQANYAASKAGLIGFTKTAAKELGNWNIRVNAVAPGFIETDMTARLSEEVKQKAVEHIALKRFGKPEEVAEVVAFLISPKSSYISGEIIEVSGCIAM